MPTLKEADFFKKFYESQSPSQKRNFDRRMKVTRLELRILKKYFWLNWPILNVMTTFWLILIDEGPVAVLKPRWGALTFSYLNDGMKPTLWHTIMQIINHPRYSGLYIKGAPRNKKEAEAVISGEDSRYSNYKEKKL